MILNLQKHSFKIFFIFILFFGLFLFINLVSAQVAEGQDCECEFVIYSSDLGFSTPCDIKIKRSYPVSKHQFINWPTELFSILNGITNSFCPITNDIANQTYFRPPTSTLPQDTQEGINKWSCQGFPKERIRLPNDKSFEYKINCSGEVKILEGCDAKNFAPVCKVQAMIADETEQDCIKRRVLSCEIAAGIRCIDGTLVAEHKLGCSQIETAIKGLDQLKLEGGSMKEKVQNLVGRVIKYMLGFTGSVALAMFVGGGLIWMTARGNSEKTAKALKMMTWAALGVVVILSSYVIIDFIFDLFR
ncbi:MAG: pilin [bacterium]|nr:pilin [bacterium]